MVDNRQIQYSKLIDRNDQMCKSEIILKVQNNSSSNSSKNKNDRLSSSLIVSNNGSKWTGRKSRLVTRVLINKDRSNSDRLE